MEEYDFKRVAQNTKEILYPLVEDSKIAATELDDCIDEISALYKKYYDQGLEPKQISHVLLQTAIAVMLASRDLNQAMLFSEYVRSAGDRACKTISSHWPPIDKDNWPIDPKQWPAD